IAVATAYADGAIGTGLRHVVFWHHDGAVAMAAAEQIVEERAGVARGCGILRAAVVLCERQDNGAALAVLLRGAEIGAKLLKAAGDTVEVGAHLLDLVVDRAALRR